LLGPGLVRGAVTITLTYDVYTCFVSGTTKKNGELFTIPQEMHAVSVMAAYAGRDENVQVNGYMFVFDLTGVGSKNLTRWSMDDMRNWHNCWQVCLFQTCQCQSSIYIAHHRESL